MFRIILTASVLALAGRPAFAHLVPVSHGSFAAGFSHPVFGADHVLAMVAVGLWAAMQGGRAMLAVPAAFVGVMALGFGLAIAGLRLPLVEPVILASVVVLGLLVALAVRLPVAAGAALTGMFALFHGHAHGAEMGGATALTFLAGFVAATALLHAAGLGVGLALARAGATGAMARALGGLVALGGAALAIAG